VKHAKASSAGSTSGHGRGRSLCGFACLCVLGLAAFLGSGASVAGATPACPNEAIREQQHATFLPDCRAYELVSPAQKFGYSVGEHVYGDVKLGVAPSGDLATYSGAYALEGSAVGTFSGLEAARGEGGWSTGSIPVPGGENQMGNGAASLDAYLVGTTPDQRTAVYRDDTTSPYGSLWVRRADGSRQRIVTDTVRGDGFGALNPGQAWFWGISADGKHVVFADSDRLLPGLPAGSNDILYEWVDDGANGGAGTLRVVNRTNSPTPTLIDEEAAELGGATSYPPSRESGVQVRDAISADGSRIFFQNPAPAGYDDPGGPVYLREDGTRTVEVSAPNPGYAPGSSFQYLAASSDGSVVYFWSNGQLAAAAPGAGGIYRYDVPGEELSFVGEAHLEEANPGAEVSTQPALASADGSHLYFIGNDGPGGGAAIDVYFNGAVHHVSNEAPGTSHGPGLYDGPCADANVTPDGRFFAFAATNISGGIENNQIYRYDAQGEEVVNVVTTPLAGTPFAAYGATFAPGTCGGGYPRPTERIRVMSNDGQYVFFDSPAPLVPGDNNGVPDAYEWHDGEVSLLGSGSGTGSAFAGADASGANAFLITAQPLAPQDIDHAIDIYDARVNGGFLAAGLPASCSGDECQGEAGTVPGAAAIGSWATGPGNAHHARRQAKKKRRHHAAKAKRHAKKRGAK
jgi:hypothetical protein